MNAERKTVGSHQERVFSDTDAVEPGEDQLVKTSQRGDQKALSCSCSAISAASSILACRLVGDYDEASEIIQEAFVAAWQGMPDFRGETRFSTWLYCVTPHCGLRQLEKRKRETVWE